MARVPLQTGLNQELTTGSEVQFSPGSIEPMKDVVSDDITRSAKALTDTGKIIQKLDDELNDAESKRLYNNFTADLNEISYAYLNKDGYEALQVVNPEDGTTTRVYDEANNQIKSLLEKYQGDASNGVVKYMFENMAQVAIQNKQTLMTQHSLKQQRLMLDKETEIAIGNHQENAIEGYESWRVDDGIFKLEMEAGAELIKEQAIREGLNVQIGPNGEPISPIYLERLSEYYMGIHTNVIERLKEAGLGAEAIEYANYLDPNGDNEITISEIKEQIIESIDDHNGEIIVNAIINSNNPTDYSFTNQAGILEGLSSNNNSDNNNGGLVISGFNTDELNVEQLSQTERFALLEAERNKSIFYQVDSTKTLIPQHQTTHLFAIQRLGVETADKLYTTAYNSIEFDKEKYNTDFDYKQEIDGKILDKYIELVSAKSIEKYSTDTTTIKNRMLVLERGSGSFGLIPGTDSYKEWETLREELREIEEKDSTYQNQIIKDLEILKNNVSYVDIKTSDIVNEITGLQPIEVYQEHLKNTISNPEQLESAMKELEIKYNQITEEKEGIYNENFIAAQEIAFAKEGGWKDLAANNIDITAFTIKDQKILKDGQPEESDAEALAELIDNPEEVRDNIDAHRYQLSNTDFLKLKRLAEGYQNEQTYIEAVGDKDLMKDVMFKLGGYDWVYKPSFGGKAEEFNAIFKEWEDRIDYAQIQTGNKLSRQEKEEILKNVLLDKVNLKSSWFDGKSSERNILQSTLSLGREDDIYVNVNVLQDDGTVKPEEIFISDIPQPIITEIMHSLFRRGEPMNQQNIAEEWVKFGKPESLNDVKDFLKNNNLEIYELMYEND